MTIFFEERPSDSPYIENVTYGGTAFDGVVIRPSEIHWHMVLSRFEGKARFTVVGPWTSAGELTYTGGADILWIKLRLGTFLPWLPGRKILNSEIALPEATSRSVWLNGSAWQFPDYENVETFVNHLYRTGALALDPVVHAALNDQQPDVAPRTLRHRFLQSTGLTQNHIQQYRRAQRATAMLQQGTPILDTVFEAGYFDQPHMTKSLRQFIGYTPAQILRGGSSDGSIAEARPDDADSGLCTSVESAIAGVL